MVKGMIVNQKELAQCLGISTRRARQLKDEGLFKVNQPVKGYLLAQCVQEYIEYKINAETGRRASISKEEVQAEHEEVKKQISLLKLRKLRRELHEAADVEAYLSDMLIRFKTRLLALPPKLAMEVAGEEDLNTIMQTIRKALEATLGELAEYNPDEIDGLQSVTELEEEEGGDDEEDDMD